MRYYIADLHFFHNSMNFRMDKRGFQTEEEMNEHLIRQWNSRVRRNDEVVILGDLSIEKAGPTAEIVKRLKGKKYLIAGNHDKFLLDKSFDMGLFEKVAPYLEMNDNGRKVILCHYPVFCYNGQYRIDEAGNGKAYMLHGHVHNTYDQALIDRFVKETKETRREIRNGFVANLPCNILNCFCVWSEYVPLTLDEWIAFHETRRRTGLPKILDAIPSEGTCNLPVITEGS